jgi:hypothetical protein
MQSNEKYSDGCAAVNNFGSADNELSQEPYLSVRPSLELNGSIPDAETPLGHPPLDMENEMLKANPVSDSVNCYSGKLVDDAQTSKSNGGSADNRKNESVVLKVMPSNSGKLGDDAQTSKSYGGSADNRKNESVVLKVMPSNSSQRPREMHGRERNSVVLSEKCNEFLRQGIMIAPCKSLSFFFFPSNWHSDIFLRNLQSFRKRTRDPSC